MSNDHKHHRSFDLLPILSEDDVRDMLRARPHGWNRDNNVNRSHLSEFMAGKRGPMTDVLTALGLEYAIVRKVGTPPDQTAEAKAVAREGGWQPIETAPKDGAEFIGGLWDDHGWWTDECVFADGEFMPSKAVPDPTRWKSDVAERGTRITAWRPSLPAPPERMRVLAGVKLEPQTQNQENQENQANNQERVQAVPKSDALGGDAGAEDHDHITLEDDGRCLRAWMKEVGMTPSMMQSDRDHWKRRAEDAELLASRPAAPRSEGTADVREALQKVEWIAGTGTSYKRCPSCWKGEHQGHHYICKTGRALKHTPPDQTAEAKVVAGEDAAIVGQVNDLARIALRYVGAGFEAPPEHQFWKARDPRSAMAWRCAVEMYEHLFASEVHDAVLAVEEDETDPHDAWRSAGQEEA